MLVKKNKQIAAAKQMEKTYMSIKVFPEQSPI